MERNRHAYLIIAHTDVKLLQKLLCALDDRRNDIYVHIDKKAEYDGADLYTRQSHLYILDKRIDARWGDFSLVEVELLLFKEAAERGLYSYFHLLSGVDLPIKSQDYIHHYCDKHQGTEFIGFSQNATERELQWRSQHYFLFARRFSSKSLFLRLFRAIFIKLQDFVGYHRSRMVIKKGSQWCSLTADFVSYILSKEVLIKRCFSHTYCPDEMVLQSLCWNSVFRERVYNLKDEFEGCKRYIKWRKGELLPLTEEDVEDMKRSNRWFARKFSERDTRLIKEITIEARKWL